MAHLDEIVSEQFRSWERRGRGWDMHEFPVSPEPLFQPFRAYQLPEIIDDGRKETFLSSLFGSFQKSLANDREPEVLVLDNDEMENEPVPFERDPLLETQILLPEDFKFSEQHSSAFLEQLDSCCEPVAFEIVGQSGSISMQLAAHPTDAAAIERSLSSLFPEAAFIPAEKHLQNAWDTGGEYVAAVDFGLEDEFMLPLATEFGLDPFIRLFSAMSELNEGETAMFQVLFEPARSPWGENALRAISNAEGRSLFSNRPRLFNGAEEKFRSPLFATVIRILTSAIDSDRVWHITRDLAFSLRSFSNPEGNGLIPLHNRDYPIEIHIDDILKRQSRRTGMLINREELMGFFHFPGADVRFAKLKRQIDRTKSPPLTAIGNAGLVLGENTHRGETVSVALSPAEQMRHAHVIGASGTGKSSLLFNLINQGIHQGEGIALLDPHGDLIERILGFIPPERFKDVVLIDPSDEEFSVGFNILSAHSDLEKNLLASDLVSVFERLSTSWGDQMGIVFQNAILAFLESTRGGTLADLRRFLIEPPFRNEFLDTVQDSDIVYYWRKSFPQLTGNKSIGPVLTRLETFLAPKPIRYMVAQSENRIDFADILNTGKIFLAKLPQGLIGKENSFLLGSLLVAKFQQSAMARQAQRIENRRTFTLYIDEFHNFITPSMAEILSGARKYNLGLVLAHQELRQLERDREVASAVLSNPYTRIVFRVGDADAKALENGFAYFTARDIQNLKTGEAICRIEKADHDFNLTIPFHGDEPDNADAVRRCAIASSRAQYGTLRAEIESALKEKSEINPSTHPKPPSPVLPPHDNAKRSPSSTIVEPAQPAANVQSTLAEAAPPPADTISNENETVATAETKPTTNEARESRDLGRGGHQHKSIQQRIKSVAEKLGYKVTIELPVLERSGSIDLALELPHRRIAVEITIATTIDHEVGNVRKCLKAGFAAVALVASSLVKLDQLKAAVTAAIEPGQSSGIAYFLPDQFCEHLVELAKTDAAAEPQKPKATRSRGYKVTMKAPKLTEEELQAKEDSWMRTLNDGMSRKGAAP